MKETYYYWHPAQRTWCICPDYLSRQSFRAAGICTATVYSSAIDYAAMVSMVFAVSTQAVN